MRCSLQYATCLSQLLACTLQLWKESRVSALFRVHLLEERRKLSEEVAPSERL